MIKNIIKVFSSNILIAIIGLISSLVFPKIMDIDSYAQYQTFNLYLSYISLAQMGLATGMVINYAGKDYDKIEIKKYKSEVLLLFILLSVAESFMIILGILTDSSIIYLIAVILIPYNFVETYKSLYQAWSLFTRFSIVNMIIPLFRVTVALLIYVLLNNLSWISLIVLTIISYMGVFTYVFYGVVISIKKTKADKIFSLSNFATIKLGFNMMLGNYLDTLLKSVDKLFVNLYYPTHSFAFFSFALTVENIMKIAIASIAQPMFPVIASGQIKGTKLNIYKEILIIFGALSGISYFAGEILITFILDKYTPSLEIIFVYFMAFPAIAVIDCIFLNLYKARKETRSYIISLISFLILAFILNSCVVCISCGMVYIAYVTVLVYYIWFVYGCIHFPEISFDVKDFLFLFLYLVLYFIIQKSFANIIGLMIFAVGIIALSRVIYKDVFFQCLNYLLVNLKKIRSR